MTSSKLHLRPYQSRIVQKALHANTIVVLPTGSGKTFIAAETILRVGTPALFLVPTCLLVEQQTAALSQWTSLDVKPYMGSMPLPPTFDILVSTPKAFQCAQSTFSTWSLQWDSFKTVVFDEVHHLLKEHPYRRLAAALRSSGATPRIQGLTASYTYALGEKKVAESLRKLCAELNVTQLETADENELIDSGYNGHQKTAEVIDPIDVVVKTPGTLPESERKPHLMAKIFFLRVLRAESTPFCRLLTECVLEMEYHLATLDSQFKSPLQSGLAVKEWGKYAHTRASATPPNLSHLYTGVEPWYEALRLLVVTWEESDFGAVLLLRLFAVHKSEYVSIWPQNVRVRIENFWRSAPTSFPRLDRLRNVLLEKYNQLDVFRGIIFVQQRVTTHILEYFIRSDPQLNALFQPTCLYTTSFPASPSLSVSRVEVTERIQAFADGTVNLLVATAVAEEGMDVPSANCVIRFDAMNHAVSMIQARGRARQENSSFVVLEERADRPTSMLAEAERQQREFIRNFNPTQSEPEDKAKARIAQENRERSAAVCFSRRPEPGEALTVVNQFCQKTKVQLMAVSEKDGQSWICNMEYASVLRRVNVKGYGQAKRTALQNAAQSMYMELQKQVVFEIQDDRRTMNGTSVVEGC